MKKQNKTFSFTILSQPTKSHSCDCESSMRWDEKNTLCLLGKTAHPFEQCFNFFRIVEQNRQLCSETCMDGMETCMMHSCALHLDAVCISCSRHSQQFGTSQAIQSQKHAIPWWSSINVVCMFCKIFKHFIQRTTRYKRASISLFHSRLFFLKPPKRGNVLEQKTSLTVVTEPVSVIVINLASTSNAQGQDGVHVMLKGP